MSGRLSTTPGDIGLTPMPRGGVAQLPPYVLSPVAYDDDFEEFYDEPEEEPQRDTSGILGNTRRPEAESVSVYTRSGRPVANNAGTASAGYGYPVNNDAYSSDYRQGYGEPSLMAQNTGRGALGTAGSTTPGDIGLTPTHPVAQDHPGRRRHAHPRLLVWLRHRHWRPGAAGGQRGLCRDPRQPVHLAGRARQAVCRRHHLGVDHGIL